MKILIILSRIPYPLEKGDKLRAYHQIRILAQKNEIHLIALNDKQISPEAFPELQKFCKSIYFYPLSGFRILCGLLNALFTGLPFQTGYFYNKDIKRKITRKINEISPDIIYSQLVRTGEYIRDINEIPVVLDYMDAFSKGVERRMKRSGWLKPLFKMEYNRLLKYERLIYEKVEAVTIITAEDRKHMPLPDPAIIHVIPNGVEIPDFIRTDYTFSNILFTGNMSYPPNVEAGVYLVKKIVPLLSFKPQIILAGAEPSGSILKLKSENVKITGWVNDLKLYYQSAGIFVAPMLLGTGLQNKLLEAMSFGIPVITSPLANLALGARPEEEILIAQSPMEYAHHIQRLIEDPLLASKIGQAGRNFVQANFSWESSVEKLEKIFLENLKS